MSPLTYAQRLQDVAGRLEGLVEDTASAADAHEIDVRVAEECSNAFDAIERALELI
jgi:hypothetical protein